MVDRKADVLTSQADLPELQSGGADAWRGEDLADATAWVHVLDAEEIRDLLAARKHALASGRPRETWQREDFPLPVLGPSIDAWLDTLHHGRAFQLVRGFPVRDHDADVCADIYWGLGLYIGEAVSQNTDGDLLGHVRDTGLDPSAYGVRLYKTRAEQDFHTDAADIIGLFCLRGAKSGGVSRIVSSPAILNEIQHRAPELLPSLFEPFPFDTQGQHAPGGRPWFELPLCRSDAGRVRTFFVPWYIRESQQHEAAPRLGDAQVQALEMIEAIANDPAFHLDMHFQPGDIQLLKNSFILHKRTAFEDFEADDEKRHLLRLWLNPHSDSHARPETRRGIARREVTAGSR